MEIKPIYGSLPLSWKPNNPIQNENDRRWLESVVRNAAPFSDWWVKARIVQLAYTPPLMQRAKQPKVAGLPMYQGLSEGEIVEVLQSCCNPSDHPEFARQVNKEFVIKTLNAWKSYQFTKAISRNFDVYAHRQYENVFLAVSTAPVSLNVDRVLPPSDRFRPLFNVDELAQIMHARSINRLSLRTHGYANPAKTFYTSFHQEATALNQPEQTNGSRTLRNDHFYIGYHWPSEQPFTSPGLWADYLRPLGIVFKFLFVLSGLAGVIGTILYALLQFVIVPLLRWVGHIPSLAKLGRAWNFEETAAIAVQGYWIVPTVFMLWLLLFFLLRLVVYQRDRYRAVHYGAPDLAEFFWRLDDALCKFRTPHAAAESMVPVRVKQAARRITVNLLGHSMGALVLVNVVRILSEHGRDTQGTLHADSEQPELDRADDIGENLELDKLILASPDIPLEFLREGRNNYVRSAMRRCRRIYLMSSDRDVVLRYLSTMGNWFTEPSIQMAGMRLGNVYLKPFKDDAVDPYRPYLRIMIHSQRAVQPTSSYDLFRKFNYIDCSEMRGSGREGGVNAISLPLNLLTGLPIDLLNTLIFMVSAATGLNYLDVHGGYFQTHTPSFKILRFLLVAGFLEDDVIVKTIEEIIQDTPIRFLPSKPWIMPDEPESLLE